MVRGAGVILAAVLLSSPVSAQLEVGIRVGSPAPAVVLPDLDGRPVDLGTVLGKKPVLVEFWATWCSICMGLHPQLQEIRRTYGDRIEMFGVHVNVNASKPRIRRYLDQHRPPFRVLFDETGAGVRAFDVLTTSVVVIVDSAGRVAYAGSGEKQDLLGAVARLFGARTGP